MERNRQHPLHAITNSQSLSMLESLIPYVDYPLKLPLALLIKYYEILQILQVFQSLESLSQFGLHNINNDPFDMLGAITGISPDIVRMFSSFTSNRFGENPVDMMSMLGGTGGFDPQMLQGFFSDNNHSPYDADNTVEAENDSFNQKIQSIFSEYDMTQKRKEQEHDI